MRESKAMLSSGGVDGGGVVAGTAQVGELSEQLRAAQETVVVDHQVGVDFASLFDVSVGSVAGDGDAGALASVAVRVKRGPLLVFGGDGQVLDATFGHGFAVFVKENFSHAERWNFHGDGSAAAQASTVQGQALGKGDGLGYGAWVFCDVFCIHSVTSCGVSTPRWMKRRRSSARCS